MNARSNEGNPLPATVKQLLDRFELAWQSGTVPAIEDFLPAAGDDDDSQEVLHAALVELVKVDQEYRWRGKAEPQKIEAYLTRHPQLASDYAELGSYGQLPADLIAEEYRARQRFGDRPGREEYHERFPALGEKLGVALKRVDKALATARSIRHTVDGKPKDAPPEPNALRVRCPHCLNAIEILDEEESLSEIACPSCGSSFSLIDDDQTMIREADQLRTVGHFELIEQLGTGGFGTVWKARDTKLDRTVAIKIPRKGQLTKEETEGFLREARTAAQLRHPNIVSVHEVGRDEETVYIVSDFVHGLTLADWQTGQQSTPNEVARLCAQVTEALDHAHEVGVIHRDLKPANIMIDGEGQTHLMDFGLAKRDVGEITMTIEGRILGTPAYMSPEQARGEAHTADRRTDIYSLGVVLYQLLTGELPFRGNPRMLMHQVLNDEPRSPRSLNDQVPKDMETICLKAMAKEPARRYQSAKAVGDDLRRYLAGEPIHARPVGRVERAWRWSKRQPVVASLAAAVTVSLIIGTAVSTYFAVTATAERDRADLNALEASASAKHASEALDKEAAQRQIAVKNAKRANVQAERANTEAKTAETVSDFLSGMFQGSDFFGWAGYKFQEGNPGRADISVMELLEIGALSIEEQLVNEPAIQAKLLDMIGLTYLSRSLVKEAAPLLERALKIRRELHSEPHRDLAGSLRSQSMLLFVQGYVEEAIPMIRKTNEMRAKLPDASLLEIANDKFCLAWCLAGGGGDVREAEQLFNEVLDVRRQELGPTDRQVAYAIGALVMVYLSTDRSVKALELIGEAAETFSHLDPDDNPLKPLSMLAAAAVDAFAGDIDEARIGVEETVTQARRTYGENHIATITLQYVIAINGAELDLDLAVNLLQHAVQDAQESFGKQPRTADITATLARLLRRQSKYREAIDVARQTLEIRRACFGDEHQEVADSLDALASILSDAGAYEEAERRYREALDVNRRVLGSSDPQLAVNLNHLADLARDLGNYADAERLFREALAIDRESSGEHDREIAADLSGLAVLHRDMRDYEKAEELLNESLAINRNRSDADVDVADNLVAIARVKRKKKEYDEAEKLLTQALAIRRKKFEPSHREIAYGLHDLALLRHDQGRPVEAQDLFQQALDMKRDKLGPRHSGVANTLSGLASVLQNIGEFDKAEGLYREALDIRRETEGTGHLNYAASALELASLLYECGEIDEAQTRSREALDLRRRLLPDDDLRVAAALVLLGTTLVDQGRLSEARNQIEQAVEIRRDKLPSKHWLFADAEGALGTCLSKIGEFDEAERLLLKSYATINAEFQADDKRTQRTVQRLVDLYSESRNSEQESKYRALLLPMNNPG